MSEQDTASERQPRSRWGNITARVAQQIYDDAATGRWATCKDLGEKYQVDRKTVRDIIMGRSYRQLDRSKSPPVQLTRGKKMTRAAARAIARAIEGLPKRGEGRHAYMTEVAARLGNVQPLQVWRIWSGKLMRCETNGVEELDQDTRQALVRMLNEGYTVPQAAGLNLTNAATVHSVWADAERVVDSVWDTPAAVNPVDDDDPFRELREAVIVPP